MHYFDNEAAWEAFRAEAESWLGTPYRHLQRCRGRGADCTLFVGQALLDAGLLTRLEYDYYPRDWHEHTRDEYVLEASHRHMRDYLRPGLEMASLPVGTPLLRGDWLAFSTTERRVTNHCGLVWPCADGGFQMLHAINDRGVSFTPLGNWWLRRMTRALPHRHCRSGGGRMGVGLIIAAVTIGATVATTLFAKGPRSTKGADMAPANLDAFPSDHG